MLARGSDGGPENQPTLTPDLRTVVYGIIAAIPYGSVTTYGEIARAAGIPRDARRIGWWVSAVPEELGLPCHRIVNAQGRLSGGWAFGHPDRMKAMLEDEGITFIDEYRVDLKKHLWTPGDDQPPPTK